MNKAFLSTDFAVSGQIMPDALPELKKEGFKTIICNRPDGEDPGQPRAKELAQACHENGLTFVNLPITPGEGVPKQIIEGMRKALMTTPPSYLAYCRSGKRSEALWHAVSNVDFN